ncbi:uncharacterized protein TNCT_664131 [Trichonephila clavata]|uniref:Uncharacterized protein n=1 Tax=Trichonephila clavata TaxID=2740835 RepID=A0A8X6K7Z9_TRICU|nr:uncharacterized protein TNCT_664131 [Trichonephila clavata]
MVQSVELGLDQNTDPSRMRSPAIDGAVHRTLHVHQHLHHRPDGMVSKIPIRTQDGLGGNVLYPVRHNGELDIPTKGEFAGSINCDDSTRLIQELNETLTEVEALALRRPCRGVKSSSPSVTEDLPCRGADTR